MRKNWIFIVNCSTTTLVLSFGIFTEFMAYLSSQSPQNSIISIYSEQSYLSHLFCVPLLTLFIVYINFSYEGYFAWFVNVRIKLLTVYCTFLSTVFCTKTCLSIPYFVLFLIIFYTIQEILLLSFILSSFFFEFLLFPLHDLSCYSTNIIKCVQFLNVIFVLSRLLFLSSYYFWCWHFLYSSCI